VRAEFRERRFLRTTEEGVRQCAELSAVSVGLVQDENRKNLHLGKEKRVGTATRPLMSRSCRSHARWEPALGPGGPQSPSVGEGIQAG
jgi:hypothetical protein